MYYLIAFPVGVQAYRRGLLSLGDVFLPLTVIALWSLLAALGFGAQSLGNLVELLLLLFVALGLFYVRIVYVCKRPENRRFSLTVIYALTIALVVISRLAFPHIAE